MALALVALAGNTRNWVLLGLLSTFVHLLLVLLGQGLGRGSG